MNNLGPKDRCTSRLILTAATFMFSAALACNSPAAGASMSQKGTPDLSIGAAQFPDDDAVILRWVQRWTLQRDGTVHRRDHRWLKLLNRRPIRRFGDPRLDFVHGQDKLVVHTARTHLPDGEILRVPKYSFNLAAPNDVAGWPEYANWQQQIVSFSGIETNAVLELDYEVVTPAGVLPWVEADLRLNEDYPTVERVVTVTLPEGTALNHQVDRAGPARSDFGKSAANGAVTYRWTFKDLAGGRAESQSPPWQQRSGRLRFTTAPSAAKWVSIMSDRIDQAGQPDETIKEFCEFAVEDEVDATQRMRKIAKKLHDSFNVVDSPKSLRSLTCRSAAQVFRANYGNPLESAALYLAALRSLGMEAAAQVAVDATIWDEQVPTGSALAGAAVVVKLPEGPMYIHPQDGVFENPGHFGRHLLLDVDASGTLRKTYVYGRGEAEPSELQITGKITVDAEGQASGELRIRLTGLFFDPLPLETGKAQKKLVSGLTDRLVTGFEVTGHSITALSNRVLRATVNVASKDELKRYGTRRVLRLGDGPVFLADVPMPLAQSRRETDVRLAGRFREIVDLTVELPEGWKVWVVPASPRPAEGTWGSASQILKVTENTVRLRRNVAVTTETLGPDDFAGLRRAINKLRADQSLMLVFGETSQTDETP
ncbi:MAG: DUF3857 domain-containing protein [Phycisphaerales bacterium]|nr:MAG: DUF3857 domain-containing protein [Phycisphaerales bacterium]